MIKGQVSQLPPPTSRWAPLVTLTVRNPADPSKVAEIAFEVDTAYTGALSLMPSDIQVLALPEDESGVVQLADGSSQTLRYFTARIDWDNQSRLVRILELDSDPLLGMGLLWGSRLTVDAMEGGGVSIEEIPGGR